MSDILDRLRKVSREEAKKQTHDVPDPPDPDKDAKEMKKQLDEERAHGHPAWKAKDDDD